MQMIIGGSSYYTQRSQINTVAYERTNARNFDEPQ